MSFVDPTTRNLSYSDGFIGSDQSTMVDESARADFCPVEDILKVDYGKIKENAPGWFLLGDKKISKVEKCPHRPELYNWYNFQEETYEQVRCSDGEAYYSGPTYKKLSPVNNAAAAPYVFKEGTSTLDIEMEPNIYADTLSKMGFIFFRVNNDRLRASSFDVQSRIILELSSRYEDHINEDDLPYTDSNNLQFVLMERKTGRFAAVLFAKFYTEEQRTHILSLSVQDHLQGRNLGSMLCALCIDYYYTNKISSVFELNPFENAIECYSKLGFIQLYSVIQGRSYPGQMELDLDLSTTLQVFSSRKVQLKIQPFFVAMSKGKLEVAKQFLPELDSLVTEYKAEFPLRYNPSPALLDQLTLRELVALQRSLDHKAHREAIARRSKVPLPLGIMQWVDELEKGKELLQKAKVCIEAAAKVIPSRIDSSYKLTRPTTISPSSFQVRDTDRYDLSESKLANELSILRVSLKLFNECFSKLSETEKHGFLEGQREPIFYISEIGRLLDMLKKCLPIVNAPVGTLFTYTAGSTEKKYVKTSQYCSFSEV